MSAARLVPEIRGGGRAPEFQLLQGIISMTSNMDTGSMHLAALVRDFIIYIDHECFERPDELQRFLGDSSQYLRRYNRKVIVNTDYVTAAQKTLSDASKLHTCMQRLETSGRLERLDAEDIETAVSDLLEKDNVLLITQDRAQADAVFGMPRLSELTTLYIKTIAESADMQDFTGIRPKKSIPLGNAPMQAATVKHIILDISSLKFEWTSYFLEDITAPMVLNQHAFTLYVLNRQLEEARKEGEISRAVHRVYGHFNHENMAETRDELKFKDDARAIQKLRTQGNIAVLTYSPARAGNFYNFNDKDLSGRIVLPVTYVNGAVSADFACPWRRDILALFENLASQVKEDSFDKYEKIAEKEKSASAQEDPKGLLAAFERNSSKLNSRPREPDDGTVVSPMKRTVDSVQIDIPDAPEVVNPGLAAPHVDMGTIDPDKGLSGQMDAIIPSIPRQKGHRPFDPVSGLFDKTRSVQKNQSRTVSLFGEEQEKKPVTVFSEGFKEGTHFGEHLPPKPAPAAAAPETAVPAPEPREIKKDFERIGEVSETSVAAVARDDFPAAAESMPDPLMFSGEPRAAASAETPESFVSLNPLEATPVHEGEEIALEGVEQEDLSQEGRRRQEELEQEREENASRPSGRILKPLAPPDPDLETRSETGAEVSGGMIVPRETVSAERPGILAAPEDSLNPPGMIQNPNAPSLGGGLLNPEAPSLNAGAVTGGILNPEAPSLDADPVTGGIQNPEAPTLDAGPVSARIQNPEAPTLDAGPVSGGIQNPEAPTLDAGPVTARIQNPEAPTLDAAPVSGGILNPEAPLLSPLGAQDEPFSGGAADTSASFAAPETGAEPQEEVTAEVLQSGPDPEEPLKSAAPELPDTPAETEPVSQEQELRNARKEELINTLFGRGKPEQSVSAPDPEPVSEPAPEVPEPQDDFLNFGTDEEPAAASVPETQIPEPEESPYEDPRSARKAAILNSLMGKKNGTQDNNNAEASVTAPQPEFKRKNDLLKSLAGSGAFVSPSPKTPAPEAAAPETPAEDSAAPAAAPAPEKPAALGGFNMESFLGRKIPKPVKKKQEEETENAYGHKNLKLKGSTVGFTLPPEQQARLEKRREQERLQREAEERARQEQLEAELRKQRALDESRSAELRKQATSFSDVPESDLVVQNTVNPLMPEGRETESGKPDVALTGVADNTPDELAITEEEARERERYRAEAERLAREEAARNAPKIDKEALFNGLMKKNSELREQRAEAEKKAKEEKKRNLLDKFKKKTEELENKRRSREALNSVERIPEPEEQQAERQKVEKTGRNIELAGNTTGFTLNQNQMDAIEKHRAVQRDIIEKERLQKLEWQKPKEKHAPTNFQMTEQPSVFKVNEEENAKFAKKREINKVAKGEAKEAEKLRQESEHEEMLRKMNMVKAIEEYNLDGQTSDFVFDPSQIKPSEPADLEDFVMTPERQERLRRFEASTRPEVEVKRDLGGASLFRSEEGTIKKPRPGSGRRTGSVAGFNAGLLSDQRQKVVRAVTNEERSMQDLAAVDKAIMERVQALNNQAASQPKPQIRTTVTQAVESHTVEVVAQKSISSGEHVALDVSREAPDNSELAVSAENKSQAPHVAVQESSEQITLEPDVAVEAHTTVAENHEFPYTGKPYNPPVDLGMISIPTFGGTVIINNHKHTLDRPLVMSQSLAIFENDENTVIRIFGSGVLNANMIAKLLAMIETPIAMKGIDWPLTLAKNESNDIVGCVLNKENTSSLQSLCKSLDSSSFVILNRKNLVKMAINLVEKVVALNKMNIFIGQGDMNSIVVDGDDEVSFVNMERCQIGDYLYTTMPSGIIPPELNDEEPTCADELSDRYVVAEVLFRIFFLGRGPYVKSRRQGVIENQYSAFRFPTNYYDEMTAPMDISLYIWSFFPEYIRKAFIDTLNYGYHNRELRVDCIRWLFFLKRWLEDFDQNKLSPMAYEIKPSRMNIGNASDMVACKICQCPVTKTESVATDGLCHNCFTQRGKLHVCDCCNREFMVSYRDLMVGTDESRRICHDCRVKFHRINAIVKCHNCSRNYTVSDGDLTMFGERVYSTCPECLKKIRAKEALGLAPVPETPAPDARLNGNRDVINAIISGKAGKAAQKEPDEPAG